MSYPGNRNPGAGLNAQEQRKSAASNQPINSAAVEALERAKTAASKAAEDAQLAYSQASLARVRELQQTGANYQQAAQAILNAAVTVGDVPGLFVQDDFENALGQVDMIVAMSRRLAGASVRGIDEQAMLDAQAARGSTFATATAALRTQTAALQAALLESSAPALPMGKDEDDCDDFKDDFRSIIANGNATSQASALAVQLYQERNILGLYALLGAPMKYALQAAGVNRSAFQRAYVQAVFADLTAQAVKRQRANGLGEQAAAEQAPGAIRRLLNPGPLPPALVGPLQDCIINDAGGTCLAAASAIVALGGA